MVNAAEEKRIVWTLSPSKSTLGAITRVSSGNVINQTQYQRLRDLYRIRETDGLCAALETLKRLLSYRKHSRDIAEVLASDDLAKSEKYALDKLYRKREAEVMKSLSNAEIEDYWTNLSLLSRGKKLHNIFHNHALEDYSNQIGEVRYSQNLFGFWSFVIRSDRGFLARAKKDPYTESKAIICLYKPISVMSKVILYNIGEHDIVYNTEVSTYSVRNFLEEQKL